MDPFTHQPLSRDFVTKQPLVCIWELVDKAKMERDELRSYRGADAHNNFTYNLHSKLLQQGIKTYLYRRGDELPLPMLLKVIEE
ncbi:unnamed protein product [Prunus armeniaca]